MRLIKEEKHKDYETVDSGVTDPSLTEKIPIS